MTRSDAIEELARWDLAGLPVAERAEQLETMLLEDWSSDPGWGALPLEVQAECEAGSLGAPLGSVRYDAVLMRSLRSRYTAARSAYLKDRLRGIGIEVDEVIGDPEPRQPCPCCGRRTLGRRGDYDICRVCWWEDDGQDNEQADVVYGGPNHRVSLTQGRVNMLRHGIFDPARSDLRAVQDPVEMYEPGRLFVLSPDGATLEEPAARWTSRAFRP